jgi:predicted RNA-binding protein YlqC (UPF0109 family)
MAGAPAALVEFIVKAIVDDEESVAVKEVEGGRVLEVETSPEDRGRVIGRQGRVAKASRSRSEGWWAPTGCEASCACAPMPTGPSCCTTPSG